MTNIEPAADGRTGAVVAGPVVASGHLRGAAVRNRLFPRTRSWFALGAPVELLTSLSILRAVVALYALVWPLLALAERIPARLEVYVPLVAGVSVVIWLLLLGVRSLSTRQVLVLTTGGAVSATGTFATGHWTSVAVTYSAMLVLFCVAAAAFLPARQLTVHLLVVVPAVTLTLVSGHGWVRGLATTTAVGVTVVAVEGLVVILDRGARRHGEVDDVTGLPNGRALSGLVSRWDPATPYVLAVVAVAGLAEAREALGWEVSTGLMRRTVEDLGQVLPLGATIGRVEGDQFVVVLPAGTDEDPTEAAQRLGTDLAGAIAAGHYSVNSVDVRLRAHVGVALYPRDGAAFAELVRRAVISAGRAGRSGLDVHIWDGERGELTGENLALLADLGVAGERGELWLAYQLQVSSETKAAVGVEALLRWSHPRWGPLGPDVFITLAERTGLIERLSEWVLAAALDAQVRWRAASVDLPVSVNLSATLLTRPDLVEWVTGELQRRDLPPTCLTLEVTETAATADLTRAVSLLKPLHDFGLRVSMDDFGCGYTSLASLPYLPLDEIKVDRAFVSRAATSAADEAVVLAISDLARRLGVDSVAEGVEDQATADRLREQGFNILQGYLYARPVAEVDLLAALAARAVPDRGQP